MENQKCVCFEDGDPIVGGNWFGREPNNDAGIEGCLMATTDGGWNDNKCGRKLRAFCQKGKIK